MKCKTSEPRDGENGTEFGVVVGKHERRIGRHRFPCGQDQNVDGERHPQHACSNPGEMYQKRSDSDRTSAPPHVVAKDEFGDGTELFNSVDVLDIVQDGAVERGEKNLFSKIIGANSICSTKSLILSRGVDRSTVHLSFSLASSRNWSLYLRIVIE